MIRTSHCSRFGFTRSPALWVVGVWLTVSTSVGAELPLARLATVWPLGARQGTTIQVAVAGQDLEELSGLQFSDPRITATPAGAAGAFAVAVAADAPVGVYDVRAVGRHGVSNPRAFVVGALEEVVGKGGNVTPEAAAPLGLGVTVSAV